MKRNLIETIMGAVVIFVAVFFVVTAYQSSGIKKDYGYTVEAEFDKIDDKIDELKKKKKDLEKEKESIDKTDKDKIKKAINNLIFVSMIVPVNLK